MDMHLNNNINTNSDHNSVKKGTSLKPVFPPTKRPPEEQPLAQNLHKNIVDTPTHFETDYISMKWIPEKRRIDVVWKQFVSEDKVREVLLREVAMIRHTKVKCLFLDAQKFKGTNPNIPRWANEVWSQMVHDAGLKHFATVVSDKDIFAVFSLKYGMGEKLTSLVNCAVFKTVEEAEVWLRQYTHPESPVYHNEEVEQNEKDYENLTTPLDSELNTNIEITIENQQAEVQETIKYEKEIIETKIDALQPTTQKELQKFNLKNELAMQNLNTDSEENKIDTIEKENQNQHSEVQVFSDFEDLENYIQSIETKYKTNIDVKDSDNSENQS